ncbi:MAG: DEAD/DEAH box helicase family protein [Gammaproteobacteria bacterium]|nr:DEAD/DEAH box helicase family protein [Gammaproteobacteria bacterium]
MNEAETRAELIDPALRAAGWGVVEACRVRREQITHGRLLGAGQHGERDVADYVLIYRDHKLGVIEAKKRDAADTEGLGQAKKYAEKLQVRFAYSTNGRRIYQVDMHAGREGYVDAYPAPDTLWNLTFAEHNVWRDRFAAVPFADKSGTWRAHYYQDIAARNALEAIATGKARILLTLATGTGKTAIAFQICWKLFQSRWNLSGEPTRRPRILFLADRNTLTDQAYSEFSAFAAFSEDALVRIRPDEIRKKGRALTNGSIFFTIFQTFMTGTDAQGRPSPNFGSYPPDFFDFIVIDECHRGGANDESNWRGILEYFAPAVQLGLTATPRRTDNVDTYRYFGEPVYVYSLNEGINDGFLTPFKVKQIATTLDDYVYTTDDEVIEGEIDAGRRYGEEDFNRVIEIMAREKYRVKLFMEQIDPREKTLVFCATQAHALAARDLINQMKEIRDPNYCVRVTANDGALGDQFLKTFRDNDKTIPTILTTSQKLSTGVDARNVRNIVLMRPINSIIEFKQIIGRGTRLFDGKDYFTIYDFVKAYEHFNDPEWDGEPIEPAPRPKIVEDEKEEQTDESDSTGEDEDDERPRRKIKIKLADGKERTIQHMMATSFWGPDGRPLSSAEFMDRMFSDLPELFRDEDELREIWSRPGTRKALLESLAEKGYGWTQLAELQQIVVAENSDLFDVLAYVAYKLPTMTREARVFRCKARSYSQYDYKQQAFLDFVLSQYEKEGVGELDQDKLGSLLEIKYHSVSDAAAELGGVSNIRDLFVDFQRYLYERPDAP